MSRGTVVERFWAKVDVPRDGQGCWFWMAATQDGYGKFTPTHGARTQRAHRFAYELLVGPIPEGLSLDHICHNAAEDCSGGSSCIHRSCVNPSHLEPVTLAENARRSPNTLTGRNSRKTHCPAGHPYDEENTRLVGIRRYCRACWRSARAA